MGQKTMLYNTYKENTTKKGAKSVGDLDAMGNSGKDCKEGKTHLATNKCVTYDKENKHGNYIF